jgi:sulfur relay (sulfurtransferase) DsrF/TusC family protein
VSGQDGAAIGRRTISRIVQVLPEYEITRLYACATALRDRGLTPADLALPVRLVDDTGQQTLIAQQDAVVND